LIGPRTAHNADSRLSGWGRTLTRTTHGHRNANIDIDLSAGEWIAVAALAVSVSHLIGQIVLYSIRRRKASFEVSVQKVPTRGKTEPYEEQVVVCNHGPALATDVDVAVLGPDGEALEHRLERGERIKRVWPGQTLHLPVMGIFAAPLLGEVRVCWNDKRRRRQGEHFNVVTHWIT
jgi:hypothetical protein